jgi:hypothetical protein
MEKHFYSNIIDLEKLLEALNTLEISWEEREELFQIAHSHIHHTILDLILSELNEQDKEVFIELLTNDDNSKVWDHLNDKVENIEQKIIVAAHLIRDELHKDILETKNDS